MTGPPIGPGELLTISGGTIQVELLPAAGARLHRLRVFGHDLLRTPDDPGQHLRDPFFWGAYVMAPWSNRIMAGPQGVYGQMVDLAANFADGSAIHGQVYAVPWQLEPDGTLSVLGGKDGWPWSYRATLGLTVHGSALRIALALKNLSAGSMPAGLGLHPWFRRPLEVRINAEEVVPSNSDATARLRPVTEPHDLRSMAPMPVGLDAAWLADRDPAVALRWPEIGVNALLRAHSSAGVYIVGASPADRDAVAIEPQTHAPFGLVRLLNGERGGLHSLAPGATLSLAIKLAFDRGGSP
jgi:aldose 1-epimerase